MAMVGWFIASRDSKGTKVRLPIKPAQKPCSQGNPGERRGCIRGLEGVLEDGSGESERVCQMV